MPEVVLFDGVCNLCAASVQFILRHEAAPALRFAPVQSPAGARLMREFGFDALDANTFVLIEDGAAHVKSEAAIRVARHLRVPWRFAALMRWLPRGVRDAGYDWIARNRYRWFGRRDTCLMPSAAIAARFLNE